MEAERAKEGRIAVGYIPKDAKWWLAEIVEEIRVEGERNNVVHVNWVLIRADSPGEAYAKAMEQGTDGEVSYLNPKGQMVTIVFRGLRSLHVIHDDLEDGAEITYEELIGVPEAEITAMVRPQAELEAFLPYDPTPTPGRPDYTSKGILDEAEALVARWRREHDDENDDEDDGDEDEDGLEIIELNVVDDPDIPGGDERE